MSWFSQSALADQGCWKSSSTPWVLQCCKWSWICVLDVLIFQVHQLQEVTVDIFCLLTHSFAQIAVKVSRKVAIPSLHSSLLLLGLLFHEHDSDPTSALNSQSLNPKFLLVRFNCLPDEPSFFPSSVLLSSVFCPQTPTRQPECVVIPGNYLLK